MTIKEEFLSHFNEPMICGFDVVRCIGYGEDEADCCVIVMYPDGKICWHTAVGGYVFLDRLKGQQHVKSVTGEEWDDLFRLDSFLTHNGAPKQEKPVIQEWYNLFLVRDLPEVEDERDGEWAMARNLKEAQEIILARGMPVKCSLDHDLGADEYGNLYPTGYDFAKWLVDEAIEGRLDLTKTKFTSHSSNPDGRKNIVGLLKSYLKFAK